MQRIVFCLFAFIQALSLNAQKLEQGFDHNFKPTQYVPRYYVITEKRDSLWYREAYYVPERGLAMEGWYKDKDCEIPLVDFCWYHPNKVLKSKGTYVNGKQEGVWLTFGEEGRMRDSVTYAAGKRNGIGLRWNEDGMMVDSTQFDGAGNGVEVSWYADGAVSAAGLWVSDMSKQGRWKYYHPNGQLKATEDYAGGERTSWACFDEGGKPLDTAACPEREAEFPGGINAWIKFIQNNLKADVPVRLKAPLGQYTVVVQFIVGADGRIEGIKPLTRFGYGMEEEVERMLKKAPRWVPAHQFGTKVKAYRKQPITFVVSNG